MLSLTSVLLLTFNNFTVDHVTQLNAELRQASDLFNCQRPRSQRFSPTCFLVQEKQTEHDFVNIGIFVSSAITAMLMSFAYLLLVGNKELKWMEGL